MQSKAEIKEQMFEQIAAWQNSGLRQRVWCQQAGMTYHTFHYWYKRFKDEQQPEQQNHFVALKVRPQEKSPGIELIFGNNNRLVFHQPLSVDFIKALIS
jgi:hypothetical protein